MVPNTLDKALSQQTAQPALSVNYTSTAKAECPCVLQYISESSSQDNRWTHGNLPENLQRATQLATVRVLMAQQTTGECWGDDGGHFCCAVYSGIHTNHHQTHQLNKPGVGGSRKKGENGGKWGGKWGIINTSGM